MSKQKNHGHGDLQGARLILSIIMNLVITVSQIVGGFLSGSLALLSDALHNFSDVLALLISWVANKLSMKGNTPGQTFGYKRAEILAAMVNASALIVIAGFLIKEAVVRLLYPQPVGSLWVIGLGGLSIVLNGLSVLLLKRDAGHNLNIKSAYLHLFTDMMTSIAVLAGGALIRFTDITWIDPLLSMGIAAYLIFSSLKLLLETLRILMQFTPEHLDLDEICTRVETDPEVRNIHHVHIWQLNDKTIHLEAHVDLITDMRVSETHTVQHRIRSLLRDNFSIGHVTLQMENNCCENQEKISNHSDHDHKHHNHGEEK